MSEVRWWLRHERTLRGWSPEDAAAALRRTARRMGLPDDDIDAETLLRIEAGLARPVRVRHLMLIAEVFAIALGDLIGLTDAGRLRDWLVLARAPSGGVDRGLEVMLRRQFLRYIAGFFGGASLDLVGGASIDPGRLASALSGASVDRVLVADLQALTRSCADSMWTRPLAETLPTLRGHLAIIRRLPSSAAPGPRRQQLQQLAAQTALVLARLNWQAALYEQAGENWSTAEGMAVLAGDSELLAQILVSRTEPYSRLRGAASQQDVVTALDLLDRARELAGPSSSPYLRAWLHARKAEEYATLANGRAVDRDLEAAESALLGATVPVGHGYFSSWDSAGSRLAGYRGICEVRLGRLQRATATLEGALAATPDILPSQRAAVLADLAAAYAPAELEHACALLAAALKTAYQAGLPEKVQRVIDVRARRLGARREEPAVRRLDEQIAEARRAIQLNRRGRSGPC